jgi:hypothetical protein
MNIIDTDNEFANNELQNQLIKNFNKTLNLDTKEGYISFKNKLNLFIEEYFRENKIQNNSDNYNSEKIRKITKDELILIKIENCITNLDKLHSKNDIINYLQSKRPIAKFSGQNSSYVLLNEDYIIRKKIKIDSNGIILFKNEAHTLMKLNSEKHFPNLLAIDKKRGDIYMKYCGQLINSHNKPRNWKEQYEEIKTILFKYMISPSDIQLKNICVLNDIIYLIDFGFAHLGTKAEIIRDLKILYNVLYKL